MFTVLINTFTEMIGTILAGASVLGSVYGAIKSAEANREADRFHQQRSNELENWYNKEYNTNFLDTSAARGTLQILRNNNKEAMQKYSQNNAIRGASDESAVATADNLQRSYANNVAQIASHGTDYKNSIRRDYTVQRMGLDNLQAANLEGKSQNWSNFSNNAMNAGIGFAEADGGGAFDEWDKKAGSLWAKAKTNILQNVNSKTWSDAPVSNPDSFLNDEFKA